jgi:hypothetical protein
MKKLGPFQRYIGGPIWTTLLFACLFQNPQHHKILTPKVGKPHGSVGTFSFTFVKMCLSLEHFHALTLATHLKLRL